MLIEAPHPDPQVVAELAAARADATSFVGAKLGALELAVVWYMTSRCNVCMYTCFKMGNAYTYTEWL